MRSACPPLRLLLLCLVPVLSGPVPSAGEAPSPGPAGTRGVAASGRVTAPVKVDGVLDEAVWRTAEKHEVGVLADFTINNNTAFFQSAWDGDRLYLAVSVTDDTLVTKEKGTVVPEIHLNDGVEVFLDGDRNGGKWNRNDFHLFIRHDGLLDVWGGESGPWGRTDGLEGRVQHAVRLTEDGMVLEMSVDWKGLGVTPAPGKVLGLGVTNDDNDNLVDAARKEITWTAGQNAGDPATWGALVLVETVPADVSALAVPALAKTGRADERPGENHAPTGPAFFTYSIAQGEGATVSGNVHATDPDAGDILTYALADAPDASEGTVAVDRLTGRWTYTAPGKDFVKPDRIRSFSEGVRFRIVATDRAGATFSTDVEVRVEYAPTFRTYHLDGDAGSDDNDGLSAETAFRTFARANAAVRPGDTVLVHESKIPYGWHDKAEYDAKPGLYASVRNGAVVLTASGLPDAPVTWKAAENERPAVSANGVWSTFSIRSSYTVVEGLTFQGTACLDSYDDAWKSFWGKIAPDDDPGRVPSWDFPAGRLNSNGVGISNPKGTVAHHVTIRDCVARDFPASGFGLAGDYVVLENCTSVNNGWWEMYASSGIGVMGMRDIDENRGYKLVIRNNISAGNRHFIPWKSGTVRLSDGNGIIVDSIDGHGFDYQGRILIANNLVYANGGSGIHAFHANHIDMVNNTVFHNGTTPELGWGEMFSNQAGDVRMYNNLLCSRTGNQENPGPCVYDHNLFYNFRAGSSVGRPGRGAAPGEHNLVGVDPLFAHVAEWIDRPTGFDVGTGYPAEWREPRTAREGTRPGVWSEAENALAAGWYPGVDYDVTKREYDVTLLPGSPALGAASDEWQAVAGGKGHPNTIGIFCEVGASFSRPPVRMPGRPAEARR